MQDFTQQVEIRKTSRTETVTKGDDSRDHRSENDLCDVLLQFADDRLILGHRLSEWCGHGPFLEQDIAFTNIALDSLGQANALLELAGKTEGKGRNQDDLAYFRDTFEFRNCVLVELPIGDFAFTLVRQFLFDTYSLLLYESLTESQFAPLSAIARKAHKEIDYHVRHSREWMFRLGDGTEISNRKAQDALNVLWAYSSEMFLANDSYLAMQAAGNVGDLSIIETEWRNTIKQTIEEAKLQIPSDLPCVIYNGRNGYHSEYLGFVLAEMQYLQRSYPGCKW